MPNHCTVRGCLTNYKAHEDGSVFVLPKIEAQRSQWLRFLNWKPADSLKNVFICYKHFEPKFLEPSKKGVKLKRNMNPVPTLIPDDQPSNNAPPTAILETITCPRKPPRQRIFQEDQLKKFKNSDNIKSVEDITEAKLEKLGLNLP